MGTTFYYIIKTVNGSILFITFIGAFFPLLINCIEGMEHININYIKIAKSFAVKGKEYILGVKLPAAAPNIFSGLLIGMRWLLARRCCCRNDGGKSGIGYLTWVNYTMVDMAGVIVCMFVIGVLGATSSLLLRKLYQVLHFETEMEQ